MDVLNSYSSNDKDVSIIRLNRFRGTLNILKFVKLKKL